ncbi:MAG TPA: hypothetical protein VJ717_02165 [Gemmatimonadaceae bacterium]|nr:hypothetical protein [Gemmatimonadaceae bacterium]
MLILVTAHHSEREMARRVAKRLRMAIALPTTHLVKAADGRVAPDFVTALDAADRTLLLTTSSNTSLRTAQRLLKFTSGIGVGADRLHVVAYGLHADDSLGAQELGELLQREIFWVLPPDEAAPPIQDAAYAALATKLGLNACT